MSPKILLKSYLTFETTWTVSHFIFRDVKGIFPKMGMFPEIGVLASPLEALNI